MERVVARLAMQFANRSDFDISIICLFKRERFYEINKQVSVIEPVGVKKKNAFFNILHTFFYLRKQVKRIKPRAVFAFGEGYNAFVICALLFVKTELFVSNRASPLSSLQGIRGFLNPLFYPLAKGVIVQTTKAVTLLQSKYSKSKFHVIGNPFDLDDFKGQRKKENIILNVGHIGGKKNQDLLIEYFSKLSNWQEWSLVFIGDGPTLKACQEKAVRLGVSENVVFAGKQKKVQDYYLKSKIFAFTSTSEGFPNALGEAMAAGLACISFDIIAGPSDMIDHQKNGFLIATNNHTDFVEKLALLTNDEQLRKNMGAAAKVKMEQFEIDAIASKYLGLITS